MPGKTKIFISHSAHDTDDARFMEELIRRLDEEGFSIYCDRKRLRVGDQWRPELYDAIGRSHAAIVLVTKQALDTEKYPWVFKECSMFTILKHLKKGFPIFPIMMSNVKIGDIKNSNLEVLQLHEIMAGELRDLDSIINSIKEKLSSAKSDDCEPLYYHHRRMSLRIQSFKINNDIIRDIIDEFSSELDSGAPLDMELPIKLARVLLSLEANEAINALKILSPFMRGRHKGFIYLLAPFWLDLPSISSMEEIVQAEQKKMILEQDDISIPNSFGIRTAFGINAAEQQTACFHACRLGYYKEDIYRVIKISGDDAGVDDEGRYLRIIVATVNHRTGRREKPDNIIDNFILNYALQTPTFIIMPVDTPKSTINYLRKRFYTYIFIILTGHSDFDAPKTSDIKMLVPLLESGKEDEVTNLYWKAMGFAYDNS